MSQEAPPGAEGGAALNEAMVDGLVKREAIREPRVERAFREVRRHLFLPDTPLDDVYRDRAEVTGARRTPQMREEPSDARRGRQAAHVAARSKLTSRRTRAL